MVPLEKSNNENTNSENEFIPHFFSITQTSHFYSISKDLRFCATLKQIVNSSIQRPDIPVSEQEERWK